MHYLIRFIVEAQDAKEANSHAECVMNQLIEQHEFDWYSSEADDSRWEECWKPVQLQSKKGQALVEDAMRGQLAEFSLAMDTIRFMCKVYSDEDIFNEKFEQVEGHYLSRYQFSVASGYHANACYLFDTHGSPITNQVSLAQYLENWDGLWVVQVDCHN